jgi:S-DNA-T family DNA segregation ATPase FtsK/SpoIIIE
MANNANRAEASDSNGVVYSKHQISYLILFIFSLFLTLALLSYDSRDAAYLAGGLGENTIIHNWIGFVGAGMANLLLLVLGFGAYVFSGLLLLASGRRLFVRQAGRPIAWDYWGGLALVAVGVSMLCGIWPNMLASIAAKLNIASIPGGALGQRFCAPHTGWIRLILNPTGSALVAATLIGGGLVVIWVYDWHAWVQAWWNARRNAESEQPKDFRSKSAAEKILRPAPEPIRKPEPQLHFDKPAKAKQAAPSEVTPAAQKPQTSKTGRQRSRQNSRKPGGTYQLPSQKLLNASSGRESMVDPQEIKQKQEILQATLDSFDIEATVGEATSGPRVTLFEVLPAPGVKVERISQLSNNIAMELRAISLRILTPIPGRNSVGIEVPNANSAVVSLGSLMNDSRWKNGKAKIPLMLGRDITGKTAILDLAKAPHLLIAGATGSGKSVCINALIMSLLYRFSPEELRLIMVDPKVVEFRAYHTLPHLVVPVISDTKKVPLALRWTIREMEERYQILAKVGARNLEAFNNRPVSAEPVMDDNGKPIPDKLPFIVVIIDELADIMMTAKADVETSLARIAQLSRAVGIHTIIATQRPSVNVITGIIKANYPTRIAFQVTSQIDSRTILDGKGAEALLGQGDMLFRPPGASQLERIQGAMIADNEIDDVVKMISDQREQDFDMSVFKGADEGGGTSDAGAAVSEADEDLIQQAVEVILRDRRATTSYVQRCLRIGYNRAALIIETLEQRGIIGPQIGSMPREILISADGEDEQAAEDSEDFSSSAEEMLEDNA